jgi:hypothetical protein
MNIFDVKFLHYLDVEKSSVSHKAVDDIRVYQLLAAIFDSDAILILTKNFASTQHN